ncbi:hypothetical protein LTR47_011832 [Exophiala xenobiotica]|nr:hypothetical protein LTR92_010711 [Exophiala xenobiotica]KAK5203257.1 hypothetical protein LTR41_010981 [Exophiala xenobiotica]KAK5217620.1 hypothetical protein LTR47_011832 [Exophiala xenobiotica]KAK5243121.1 hypothetical protein LTS06_011038 [Exophiala xenobiotica]KAK5344545.1 hypothetical protein LTR61_011684 [Exophiala xenobiotica]
MDLDGDLGNSAGSSDTEVMDYLPAPLEACLKGYFAILVPDDDPTMIAFSDFVDEMRGHPHINPWWKRLIHVREFREPLTLASGLSDSELEDHQAEEVQIWTGYYGLSLDPEFLPPGFARFGWVIGASAVDEERDPWTGLGAFPEQLQTLRTSNVLKGTPHTSLQQTPVDSQIKMQLGEYLVRFPAFACGSYGFIYGCIKREGGAAFAVKHLRRTARSDKDINNETKIFTMVKGHPNTCELIEVIEAPPPTGEQAPVVRPNDVYLIHLPLGSGNFGDLQRTDFTYAVRLEAFGQAVRGLDHLHRLGIMHGDIKPTNILFTLQATTLQVRIAHYGQAIIAPTSRDHYRGTYFYMAPEVLKLKKVPNEGSPREPYNERADIYSLGIVGFELFVFIPPTGRPVEFCPIQVAESELLDVESQRSSLRSQMLKSTALTVETCLHRMLLWEARDRPSMTEVAQLEIWPSSKQQITPQAGQKRPRSTE